MSDFKQNKEGKNQLPLYCENCNSFLGVKVVSPSEKVNGHPENLFCYQCANSIGQIYNHLNPKLNYKTNFNNIKSSSQYHSPIHIYNAVFTYTKDEKYFWDLTSMQKDILDKKPWGVVHNNMKIRKENP